MFSNNLGEKSSLANMIFYNYTDKSIYKTEYEKVAEKDGYLKIPYSSNRPNVTLSYKNSNVNYIATNLYIFGAKIERISKYDYQAIMVIEHQSATNGFRTLYTCFPLANDPLSKGYHNPVDDIINGTNSTTLNINRLINGDIKTTLYENKGVLYNDIVVVFDKPIYLTSSLDRFSEPPYMLSALSPIKDIPCSPMGGSAADYEGFTVSREDKIIEGLTDVPVFCTPIDELGDAAEFTDQIVMPAIGPLSESIKSASLMNYALNFISFFVILIAVYFIVPAVYLYAFAAKIVPHADISDLMGKEATDVGIPFALVILLYVVVALLLFFGGGNSSSLGTMFMIILVTSFFIIASKPDKIYSFGFGTGGMSWFADPFFGGGFVIGGLSSGLLSFLLSGLGAGANTAIMLFFATTGALLGKLFSKDKGAAEGGGGGGEEEAGAAEGAAEGGP